MTGIKKSFLVWMYIIIAGVPLLGQGTAFGLKGGITIGNQQWDSFTERDPLLKYHGILFVESAPEVDNAAGLFAQLGYHIKGSALRSQNFFNPDFNLVTRDFQFRNLSLGAGAKQKFDLGGPRGYYLIGIRFDYTLSTNLDAYEELNNRTGGLFFPTNDFVNEFNYGLIVGGGFEFAFAELISGILEFTINPDITRQYFQPEIPNVYDPYRNQNRTIPERSIRNLTFEITLGLRFWNKVEYID